MFRAIFRKYWCDFKSEYIEVRKNSLEDILEYVYSYHKDTIYPAYSKFLCSGATKISSGHLEASCCIEEKFGYRGSIWLENIVATNADGEEVIIFSKHDRYISPKTNEAFNQFKLVAKERDAHKNFGEF